MEIKNLQALENELRRRMKIVIDYISLEILQKMWKIIDKDIYGTYTPHQYKRTHDFRDKAWATEASKAVANEIVGWVKYHPERMRLNPGEYQHGHVDKRTGRLFDDRERLAYILNTTKAKQSYRDWTFGRASETLSVKESGENWGDYDPIWDEEGVGPAAWQVEQDMNHNYPEPFFDDTLNWITQNWRRLAMEGFKKAGIPIV